MKRIVSFIASAYLLVFILAGCSSNGKTVSAETVNKPSKDGAYVVRKDENSITVVDAEPQDFSATGGLKEFYRAIVYSNAPQNVEVGQRVLIESDGPILESYPGQGKAKKVVILPTYKPEKADLSEAEVVRKAVKKAYEKVNWVPAIRYVEYDGASDIWKVGIKQEEDEYEVEVADK